MNSIKDSGNFTAIPLGRWGACAFCSLPWQFPGRDGRWAWVWLAVHVGRLLNLTEEGSPQQPPHVRADTME